ncbi:MAG: sugar isomerase domain-containing protein [Opitutales bacterium]
MSLPDAFTDTILELFPELIDRNRPAIHQAGEAIGRSLAEDGVLHTFGSGHSAILAQELERRAGGLVPVSSIVDPTGGWPETIPGYGEKLLKRYAFQYGIRPGDVGLVLSNSGKNPAPLEVALGLKERGLTVIALTSLDMAQAATSGHPSGQKLHQIADIVLDNGGMPGDAALNLPAAGTRVGPTSTLTGALLLQLVALTAIEWLATHDHPVPVWRSQNLPDGPAFNEQMAERYRHRIRRPV